MREKLSNVEEKLQRSMEELSACQAERGYAKSDVEKLRKEVGRNKHTVGELMKALEESCVQSNALRAELGKRARPGMTKQEAGVQVDGGKWKLAGRVKRHVGIQTDAENGNIESGRNAVENSGGIPAMVPPLGAIPAATEPRVVSILEDEGVETPMEEEEGIGAVWKMVRQLQGRVDQLERRQVHRMEEPSNSSWSNRTRSNSRRSSIRRSNSRRSSIRRSSSRRSNSIRKNIRSSRRCKKSRKRRSDSSKRRVIMREIREKQAKKTQMRLEKKIDQQRQEQEQEDKQAEQEKKMREEEAKKERQRLEQQLEQ